MNIITHMRANIWLYALFSAILISILYLLVTYLNKSIYIDNDPAEKIAKSYTNIFIEDLYGADFNKTQISEKYNNTSNKLIIEDKKITSQDIELFKKIPNLNSIAFYDSEISDSLIKELRHLRRLKELIIKHNYNNKGILAISQLNKLERLTISNTNLDDFLLPIKSLLYLDLSNNQLDDKDLKNFQNMHKLESLNLSNNKIGDEGLKFLSYIQNLKEIDLSYNLDITSMGIKHIVHIPAIEVLNFSGTKINVLWYDELVKLPNLKKLVISNCFTDYATMSDIVEIASLEELDISYTKQDVLSLSQLSKLSKLKKLDISFTDIDNRSLAEIIDATEYTLNELILDERLSKRLNLLIIPIHVNITIIPDKGI